MTHAVTTIAVVSTAVFSVLAIPAAPDAVASTASSAGTFVPVLPTRLLDTRNGTGTAITHNGAAAPAKAASTTRIQITGRPGLPTTGIAAVAINVTVTGPTTTGYLTAYPDNTTRPRASTVNFTATHTTSNSAIIPVGTDGRIDLYNGSGGTANLITDITGYYLSGTPTAAGAFVGTTPTRLLDTRNGTGTAITHNGAAAPAKAASTTRIQITGRPGLPTTGIAAVAINVTVTGPTTTGYLTAYPDNTTRPRASTVNFTATHTTSNSAIIPVGTDGRIDLYNGSGGTANLITDITGYYLSGTPTAAGALVGTTPTRLLDTRNGTGTAITHNGAAAPAKAASTTRIQITGRPGLPTTGIAAVAINVTVTGPTTTGYLTAYPDNTTRPRASTVNFTATHTTSNSAIIPVGTDGRIDLYNGSGGTANLITDITGYYLTGGAFVGSAAVQPVSPPVTPAPVTTAPAPATSAPVTSAPVTSAPVTSAPAPTSTVTAWGANSNGQLGNGTAVASALPVAVSGLAGVTAIAAGHVASYALTSDGHVWAWGYNREGQLGNGTTTNSSAPVQVSGLSGVIAIAAGYYGGYALTSAHQVWCWGTNPDGTTSSTVPTLVTGLPSITAIAAGGSDGYALSSTGQVWAWGSNNYGQLGNGTTTDSETPVVVSGLAGVTQIAAGGASAYALAGGTVSAWGLGADGELGDGKTVNATTPQAVSGLSGITAIAAGAAAGYAIGVGGEVWAWGSNAAGQLGNNSTTDSLVPVTVATGATAVAGGYANGYAIIGGQVLAWGDNTSGQLGSSSTASGSLVPVTVTGLTGVTAISGGDGFADAVLAS